MSRLEAARDLLEELRQNRLEVGVARLAGGGGIRVVISCNAAWYRELCGQYLGTRGQRGSRFRRPRTVIRRCSVVRCLERFLAGRHDPHGVYWQRIRPFVDRRAKEIRGLKRAAPVAHDKWAGVVF